MTLDHIHHSWPMMSFNAVHRT